MIMEDSNRCILESGSRSCLLSWNSKSPGMEARLGDIKMCCPSKLVMQQQEAELPAFSAIGRIPQHSMKFICRYAAMPLAVRQLLVMLLLAAF